MFYQIYKERWSSASVPIVQKFAIDKTPLADVGKVLDAYRQKSFVCRHDDYKIISARRRPRDSVVFSRRPIPLTATRADRNAETSPPTCGRVAQPALPCFQPILGVSGTPDPTTTDPPTARKRRAATGAEGERDATSPMGLPMYLHVRCTSNRPPIDFPNPIR
ncbi:hypothetical protein R80B4_01105 [Fibrobacteres bacterium R8-0-B4]